MQMSQLGTLFYKRFVQGTTPGSCTGQGIIPVQTSKIFKSDQVGHEVLIHP